MINYNKECIFCIKVLYVFSFLMMVLFGCYFGFALSQGAWIKAGVSFLIFAGLWFRVDIHESKLRRYGQ